MRPPGETPASRPASPARTSTPSTSASACSATDLASADRSAIATVSRRRPTWSIAGSGRAKLNDEVVELRQWDVLRVAPSTARAFEGGPDGLEFIAVGSDRPEGGDGERVDDFWTD